MIKKHIVSITEIQTLNRRIREINSLNLEDIEFIDDENKTIKINKDKYKEWKIIGLNNTDFIITDFYKTGFDLK